MEKVSTVVYGVEWGKIHSCVRACVCVCVCVWQGSEEGLLRGVEMAIGQMKSEESAKVTISSMYGFGEAGCPEHEIPGGATLVYFIRLNSFKKVWLYLTQHHTHTHTHKHTHTQTQTHTHTIPAGTLLY